MTWGQAKPRALSPALTETLEGLQKASNALPWGERHDAEIQMIRGLLSSNEANTHSLGQSALTRLLDRLALPETTKEEEVRSPPPPEQPTRNPMQRYSNVSEVPLALAVFLASDNYDYNDDPHTISATTLLKPLRQVILPSRLAPGDGLVNLADMMNNRMGSAIHDGIERAWLNNHEAAMTSLGFPKRVVDSIKINPSPAVLAAREAEGMNTIPIYLEQRLSRKLGKWTITGKFDFVGEGRVQDFKSTGVWTYKNQVNNSKYTWQGSIYRWLDPKMIHQDEMDIHYIFTDWKAGMQRSDPAYPPRRFHKQSFPLLSLGETQQFIERKLGLIEQYWDAPEEEIPECDAEDLWRSEPVFKYYKNPQKMLRATKNFEDKQDAMLRYVEDGSVGIVKEVPGQVTACKYCPAFAVCTQKDALISSGDLLMN